MTKRDDITTRQDIFSGKGRLLRYLVVYGVIAAASLVAGLQHFVLTLPQPTKDAIQFTDGIVVVTGGQQRVDDGLFLLTNGKADRMLISGVGEGVNRAVLVQELGLDDREANALFCCTELDFTAGNTRGNAVAAHQWARQHDMRSLRLVTANYHMPRVLVVFAREMPELDLYQWAVTPADLRLENWWLDRAMFRLLAREYAKYLAETIRI
ncbi:MAG: YdcF family protein [Pseudomonadota bacterium]|nr:YdcF family protein [Pseudomonadota bacterium]